MLEWIQGKLLKWLIPDKQYYIQAQGFHSHFHSIFNEIITGDVPYEQENSNEIYNGGEPIH